MTETPENTNSTSMEGDFQTWAGLIYPGEFLPDEEIGLHRYWKKSWPTNAPDGRLIWSLNRYGSVAAVWDAMLRDHAGYNFGVTFATLNGLSARRVKGAFLRTQAIGLDLDCGDDKEFASVEAIDARLEQFRLETGLRPGASVLTGSGLQAYFLLIEPSSDGERVERVQRGLIAALGADSGAGDRLRILRPPGGWNFKYDPPRLVTLFDASGARYSLEEIETKLPELGEEQPKGREKRTADSVDLGPGRPVTVVPKEIRRYLAGELPPGFKGNHSARDFVVAKVLLEAGHSEADVYATMRRSKLGTQAVQRKSDSEDYLQRTIRAAAAPGPGPGPAKTKPSPRKPATRPRRVSAATVTGRKVS